MIDFDKDTRLQREAQFHDRLFADYTHTRPARKFYAVTTAANQQYRDLIDENCTGIRGGRTNITL